MDKQIAFNSYANSIKWLSYFSMAPTSVLIDAHRYNLYRLALIKHANEQAQAAFKEFRIKYELNKPFLQKLYEMKGRGLVTYRSSYIFKSWRSNNGNEESFSYYSQCMLQSSAFS